MAKRKAPSASEILATAAISGIQDKKGNEIVKLDLRKVKHAVADFFIICHASSTRQADAIAQSVVDEVRKQLGENPLSTEGKRQAEWILIDFASVVVHVFLDSVRKHYGLEELWADAEQQTVA